MRFTKLFRLIISLSLITALLPVIPTGASTLTYGSDISREYGQSEINFTDVSQNFWAYEAIQEMARLKIIKGYPDGMFRPNRIVTRAEFAKIMVAALGITPASGNAAFYSDVPETYWAAPYINAVNSYMTGYKLSNGKYVFKPQDPVQREDVAVALVKFKGYDIRVADEGMLDAMFSDVDAISANLKKYVALAVENMLMSGYPDGTFRGQHILTRAEAAALLFKVSKLGNDNKVVIEEPAPVDLPPVQPQPQPETPPTIPNQPTANGMARVTGIIYIDGLSTADVIGKGYQIRDEYYLGPELAQPAVAAGLSTDFDTLPYRFSWGVYRQGNHYTLVYLDKNGNHMLDSDEPRTVQQITLDCNNPVENLELHLTLPSSPPVRKTSKVSGTLYIDGLTNDDISNKNLKYRSEFFTDSTLTNRDAAGLDNLDMLPQPFYFSVGREGLRYLRVYLDKDGDLIMDNDEPRTVKEIILNYDNSLERLELRLSLDLMLETE